MGTISKTYKIPTETLETIAKCGELTGKNNTQVIVSAVNEYYKRLKVLTSGGAITTTPNPNIYNYSTEDAKEIIKILAETNSKLNMVCPGLDFGMSQLLLYATEKMIGKDYIPSFEKGVDDIDN